MYKKIKKIEKASLNKKGGNLYLYLREGEKLAEIDDFGNIKEEITFLNINEASEFKITNNNFIVSFNDEKTIFYSNKGKILLTFTSQLYFLFVKENNTYIYIKNDDLLYRFDKKNNKIDIFPILEKPLFSYLYNNFLILKKEGTLYTYIDEELKISLLWQKDLSEIASYIDWNGKHEGNVKNVYVFENKLIVVAGNSVLAMNIETGDIIWQVKYDDFQPFTLHINNNFAYLSKGAFYSVIDLEKGEKVLETMLIRPFDHDEKYEKTNLAMVGSDMAFHNNYLYFSDKHKGQYYLAKLNPQTAQIEEYQILEEITSNLHPPKFYDNKMFLLDNNNNLFIYERE